MKELLSPLLARWERGDFSRDQGFDPDLLITAFTPDGPERARGPEEIAAYMRRFFEQFRDYRIEAGELQQLGEDTVLMEGRQFGTGRSSGLEIADALCIVFRFDSGRLVEMHWHPKREGALAAAGLGEGD